MCMQTIVNDNLWSGCDSAAECDDQKLDSIAVLQLILCLQLGKPSLKSPDRVPLINCLDFIWMFIAFLQCCADVKSESG